MFENIGWPEILVLVVAGLFILGPERLPDAARWIGKTVNQVKNFASGAQAQIRSEMGSDFDELAKPLNDLKQLRSLNPRRAAYDALMREDTPTRGQTIPEPAPRTARTTPNTSTSPVAPVPASTGTSAVDYDAT